MAGRDVIGAVAARQPGAVLAVRNDGPSNKAGPKKWRAFMAVVKVIELLAESEQSWEDAARQAVAEATKSVRGISSVYINEFQATVENDQVKNFRINAKISFVLEKS